MSDLKYSSFLDRILLKNSYKVLLFKLKCKINKSNVHLLAIRLLNILSTFSVIHTEYISEIFSIFRLKSFKAQLVTDSDIITSIVYK